LDKAQKIQYELKKHTKKIAFKPVKKQLNAKPFFTIPKHKKVPYKIIKKSILLKKAK